MASTLVQQYMHIVFHTKSTSITMREEDLPRVFDYIGGVIRNINGVSIQVGGRPDHIHILASMPKTMSLAEFVRTIKSNSSKWIKTLDGYYEPSSKTKRCVIATGHSSMNTNNSWMHTMWNMMNGMRLGIDFSAGGVFSAFFGRGSHHLPTMLSPLRGSVISLIPPQSNHSVS